jgi:hypothetical protein
MEDVILLKSARKKVVLLLAVVPVGLELVVSSLKPYVGVK